MTASNSCKVSNQKVSSLMHHEHKHQRCVVATSHHNKDLPQVIPGGNISCKLKLTILRWKSVPSSEGLKASNSFKHILLIIKLTAARIQG